MRKNTKSKSNNQASCPGSKNNPTPDFEFCYGYPPYSKFDSDIQDYLEKVINKEQTGKKTLAKKAGHKTKQLKTETTGQNQRKTKEVKPSGVCSDIKDKLNKPQPFQRRKKQSQPQLEKDSLEFSVDSLNDGSETVTGQKESSAILKNSCLDKVNHQTTMSALIGTDNFSNVSRIYEKEELRHLNDRLSSYITRVRQMKENANQIDSSAYLESMRILEDEIVMLKNLYENELGNVRRDVEDLSRSRHNAEMESNKNKSLASELQDR